MTLEDLKRVQEIDYELLCTVDDVCKKHNIQYFLFYGTLLGAVRHNGPIPWDDDVDIAMTRENYLRFAEIAPMELDTSKYNFKIMGSGKVKYVSEIKIGRKGTVFCMPGTEHIDIMNQVQLDVFCLDHLKEQKDSITAVKWKLWKFLSICKLNRDEKTLLSFCIDRSTHSFKSFYKLCLWGAHIIRNIIGESLFEWIGYKMLVGKRIDCNYICLTSPYYSIYKGEWLKQSVYIKYENRKFPIPIGYKEILTQTYNNYMQLPPEEKRLRTNFEDWIYKEVKID